MYFLPLYQPPMENGIQEPIQKYTSANYGVSCVYRNNVQLSYGWYQNPNTRPHRDNVLLQPVRSVQPPFHHPCSTPNNMVAVTHVHMMTVDQTANWVRTYGTHREWQEATLYEMSFRKNGVNGGMLERLNHEILRFDIGMSNDLHRLELLTIIRQLFPSYDHFKVRSEPITLSALSEREAKWDHRRNAGLAFPIPGPCNPVEEISPTVECLLPDRYMSLGMDLGTVQNRSTDSLSTKSGSEMEVSESKFSDTTIRKSSLRIKLQHTKYMAKYPLKNVSNFEGAE